MKIAAQSTSDVTTNTIMRFPHFFTGDLESATYPLTVRDMNRMNMQSIQHPKPASSVNKNRSSLLIEEGSTLLGKFSKNSNIASFTKKVINAGDRRSSPIHQKILPAI